MRIRLVCQNFKFERWRDVVGFEGYYRISDYGRLKSLPRLLWNGYGYFKSKERIRKPRVGTDGYYALPLIVDKEISEKRVNGLVAEAYCRHVPNGYKNLVNHKDGIRLNNYYKNLESVDNRYNVSDGMLRKDTSSIYTGVVKDKKSLNTWIASIRYLGKIVYLGTFKDELEASMTYRAAVDKILSDTFDEWYSGLIFKRK